MADIYLIIIILQNAMMPVYVMVSVGGSLLMLIIASSIIASLMQIWLHKHLKMKQKTFTQENTQPKPSRDSTYAEVKLENRKNSLVRLSNNAAYSIFKKSQK